MLSFQGQPPRKSNSRQIVKNRKTGKPLVIKSQNALNWLEAAAYQIPAEAKQGVGSPDQSLRITFFVRYETRLPDLSTELIMDMLQENGVIADDRYVFEKVEHKIIDGGDPGVDVLIEETQECNITRKQVQVILNDLAHVEHDLTELHGPYEDGSILTHWTDGEWFVVLPDGETTGYEYDDEGRNGDKRHIKLTVEDVIEIRKLYDAGELTLKEIAEMFGVTDSNIVKIGLRQTWKHVPEVN